MPTTLTIADVERIAALAQLELTDEEKQLFTRQLADILHYAEQVQAIDTSGVPPTDHVGSDGRGSSSRSIRWLVLTCAVAGTPLVSIACTCSA